ncbi:Alpha/Beta hydrolase protein [Xylariomycetidae sp. FL0641]|nr:Alpha/Beta hydrolase protein [Xylariomycetidae sp. FL0641]
MRFFSRKRAQSRQSAPCLPPNRDQCQPTPPAAAAAAPPPPSLPAPPPPAAQSPRPSTAQGRPPSHPQPPPPYPSAGYPAPTLPTAWTSSPSLGGPFSPPPPLPPLPPPPQQQQQSQYCYDQRFGPPSVVVNQHYYLGTPPIYRPATAPHGNGNGNGSRALSKLKLDSAVDLAQVSVHQIIDDGLPRWHSYGTQLLNQGAAMYEQIWNRFDDVMTSIDRGRMVGTENELFMYQDAVPASPPADANRRMSAPETARRGSAPKCQVKKGKKDVPKGQTTAVATSLISGGYFAKVDLYANSKLPMNLPPLKLYIPTYPLLCLAAQYSERVYEKPVGAERYAHVDADWRAGTKAMCIKSVPMDHVETIVFAIRGTATFMDWAVNLNTAPTAPIGFLDDQSNFCHAGFLSVARKMIEPVAARLRQLIEENPRRCSYSLLITGHSAGGAIAALLYMHMLSTSKAAASRLNLLTDCFKRIHCVTFGAPPVSVLPLQTPSKRQFRKSQFLSFVNEGDPVVRADKAYVKSLLELFASPAPNQGKLRAPSPSAPAKHDKSKEKDKKAKKSTMMSKASKATSKAAHSSRTSKTNKTASPAPVWRVPPCTLSNAGRIVVLRSGNQSSKPKRTKTIEERLNEGVLAQTTSDDELRGMIWGDPVCHMMRLYAERIEVLAVGAVTAKGY